MRRIGRASRIAKCRAKIEADLSRTDNHERLQGGQFIAHAVAAMDGVTAWAHETCPPYPANVKLRGAPKVRPSDQRERA